MQRAQSAMEYLVTYGIAIALIAVALATLYLMGVFSQGSPRAQSEQCHVQRFATGASFTGLCSGQLPEFVGQLDPAASASSGVIVTSPHLTSTLASSQKITVTEWVYMNHTDCVDGYGLFYYSNSLEIGTGDVGCYLGVYAGGVYSWAPWAPENRRWSFIAVTYDGSQSSSNLKIYLNGSYEVSTLSAASGLLLDTNSIFLGANDMSQFNHASSDGIANIQLYNATLSQNDIEALYIEGIGGAPIYLQALVGWWPLDADTYDYSGNLYTGNATDLRYSSAWASSYYRPS